MLACLLMSAQDSVAVSDKTKDALRLDSISISILTCTPGTDLYAKFGHTALRVKDHTLQQDVVFNYGCFDGTANDFVFKFILGQTDYLLEAEPYDYLVARYGYMGNGVKEQVLNLTKEEANRLLYLLLENIRPENQEYRYVWLYDIHAQSGARRPYLQRPQPGTRLINNALRDAGRYHENRAIRKCGWLVFVYLHFFIKVNTVRRNSLAVGSRR